MALEYYAALNMQLWPFEPFIPHALKIGYVSRHVQCGIHFAPNGFKECRHRLNIRMAAVHTKNSSSAENPRALIGRKGSGSEIENENSPAVHS